MIMKDKTNILDLFACARSKETYLKVCAPMVRYSKVQFRKLVKMYDVDLTFTPMILANSFCQNAKARSNEFLTTSDDSPLIVQFAANNVNDFVDASKLVYEYADGVDLNCGCPQRWAMKDGYGSALLSKPELIRDLVRTFKNSLPSHFTVSVKIRLLSDLKKTIDMCKQLEMCGVDFLTIHGRTPVQKNSEPINLESLGCVLSSINIPCIANGGVKTLEEADQLYDTLKCNGIMSANGILNNPAMFSGATRTPMSCVKAWMNLKNISGNNITFQCYHHHLVFMLEKLLNKRQKQIFNYLNKFEDVDDYIINNVLENDVLDNTPDLGDFITCDFDESITSKHDKKCRGCGKSMFYCSCITYDYESREGNFFSSYVNTNDDVDYMDSNIFDEKIL